MGLGAPAVLYRWCQGMREARWNGKGEVYRSWRLKRRDQGQRRVKETTDRVLGDQEICRDKMACYLKSADTEQEGRGTLRPTKILEEPAKPRRTRGAVGPC